MYNTVDRRLDFRHHLVCLDGEQWLSHLHRFAGFFEPLDDSPLFHRQPQAGHHDLVSHCSLLWPNPRIGAPVTGMCWPVAFFGKEPDSLIQNFPHRCNHLFQTRKHRLLQGR